MRIQLLRKIEKNELIKEFEMATENYKEKNTRCNREYLNKVKRVLIERSEELNGFIADNGIN